MRNSFLFTGLLFLLVLSSCLEESCADTVTYQRLDPVYVVAADWRLTEFKSDPGQEVCSPSGFYVYGDLLFIVDKNLGLHILDNGDSENPLPLSFVSIPGAQGIAVRNDVLYLNQYTDLLTFDLSNPEKPLLKHRSEDVFSPYSVFADVLPGGTYVSEWIPTDETIELECGETSDRFFVNPDGGWIRRSGNVDFFSVDAEFNGADQVGQGGSLARFTITNGTLYAVDNSTLRTFDLATPCEPSFVGTVELGWGIETIFPQGDLLFIGSTTGMHIYDASSPLNPERLSTFEHVLACDPVVVDGDLAYLTLWGGRNCGSTGDQLEVIDVSDPREPRSLQITPMNASHGLAVAEGKLFLCAAGRGVVSYALTEEGLLGEEIDRSELIEARDVIALPRDNQLIVFGYGTDGIQQYNYADEGSLLPTSRIEICE